MCSEWIRKRVARPEGVEPPTAWFVARYSIQLSYGRAIPKNGAILETISKAVKHNLAEKEGFEPSMEFNPHTPLAGERLQPLGHLSEKSDTCLKSKDLKTAQSGTDLKQGTP